MLPIALALSLAQLPPPLLVAMCDSATAPVPGGVCGDRRWVERMAPTLGYDAVSLGVPGATASGALAGQVDQAIGLGVTQAVVMCGGNDIRTGIATPSATAAIVRTQVERLIAAGVEVYVGDYWPTVLLGGPAMVAYRQLLAEMAAELDLGFAPTWAAFEEGAPYLCSDGLHVRDVWTDELGRITAAVVLARGRRVSTCIGQEEIE